jgi:hypothetical protein
MARPAPLLLKDRPEFPFYTTSTTEAAYTQWPLCQRYPSPAPFCILIEGVSFPEPELFEPPLVELPSEGVSFPEPELFEPPLVEPQSEGVSFPEPEYPRLELFQRPLVEPPSEEELELEDAIATKLERIEWNRSIASLQRLVEDLWRLGDMRSSRFRGLYLAGYVFFQAEHERVQARILALTPKTFQLPVVPALEDDILGYRMPPSVSTFSLLHDTYLTFYKAWHQKDQLSAKNLEEWLEDNCCSDWSKRDVNGEYYAGFWKYPEGSAERENAWELTRETNFQALCSLPYPSRAIMLAVEGGCLNRCESVAYTVLCCEWFKRKLQQMKDIPFESYMVEEDDDVRP